MSASRLKYLLLAVFLILVGLGMLGVGFGGVLDLVAGICGVIAGILFLVYRA